jgi:hypothetical protein
VCRTAVAWSRSTTAPAASLTAEDSDACDSHRPHAVGCSAIAPAARGSTGMQHTLATGARSRPRAAATTRSVPRLAPIQSPQLVLHLHQLRACSLLARASDSSLMRVPGSRRRPQASHGAPMAGPPTCATPTPMTSSARWMQPSSLATRRQNHFLLTLHLRRPSFPPCQSSRPCRQRSLWHQTRRYPRCLSSPPARHYPRRRQAGRVSRGAAASRLLPPSASTCIATVQLGASSQIISTSRCFPCRHASLPAGPANCAAQEAALQPQHQRGHAGGLADAGQRQHMGRRRRAI